MSKVTFKMPEEFLLKLSRLGEKTDEIIPRVLNAGGDVVAAKVKSNLQSVIGSGTKRISRSTGELVSALGVSPAKMDQEGNFNVKIGFSEPRGDGSTNALIGSVLEYGKHGQTPRPFLKPAMTASKQVCREAMVQALEQEMESL